MHHGFSTNTTGPFLISVWKLGDETGECFQSLSFLLTMTHATYLLLLFFLLVHRKLRPACTNHHIYAVRIYESGVPMELRWIKLSFHNEDAVGVCVLGKCSGLYLSLHVEKSPKQSDEAQPLLVDEHRIPTVTSREACFPWGNKQLIA